MTEGRWGWFDKVGKLKKAIYDLKKLPIPWFNKLSGVVSLDFGVVTLIILYL